MGVIIIDLPESDARKIQVTIGVVLISLNDAEKDCAMHSRTDNIKFTSYSDANEVVDELFNSLRLIYQGNLETSMEGSEFYFDSNQMMHYKFYKVNFRYSG